MKTADYTTVTETWDQPASPEQLAMQHARYRTAGELAEGRRVLEIGCGSGMGIEYLRRRAALAVGGDYTTALVREARARVPGALLARFDAQHLPFRDATFEVVLMLEMIYYLADLDQALRECSRVLTPDGTLMISVPNKDRLDFNPSPFAVGYLAASELATWLERNGFTATVYGAFPIENGAPRDRVLTPLRRFAVRHRLIPGSMQAKALVKRVLYGPLPKLGAIQDGVAEYPALVELDPARGPHPGYKNVYAIGKKKPPHPGGRTDAG
ncbi:MAG TPA: class I SAM-dependent methyltransferase [Candidatus Nitrosopolaris sp.]|nr:class I SAM-dependent methyltransferase [Candidatus Nitrosopolaris sp.]